MSTSRCLFASMLLAGWGLILGCQASSSKRVKPVEMDAVDSAFAMLSQETVSETVDTVAADVSPAEAWVEVVNTNQLMIFYPRFATIDLVCQTMPNPETDTDVLFCCEAAFTGELKLDFSHSNIADPHVSGGKWYKGYTCKANTGAFMWYDGTWRFAKKPVDLHPVAEKKGMAFCQRLLILDGETQPMWQRMRKNKTQYRALCEVDHRLCIIESKNVITFERFLSLLEQQRVTNAIYLDMGRGWNYAWYRTDSTRVEKLHPLIQIPFTTNWVVFKR